MTEKEAEKNTLSLLFIIFELGASGRGTYTEYTTLPYCTGYLDVCIVCAFDSRIYANAKYDPLTS